MLGSRNSGWKYSLEEQTFWQSLSVLQIIIMLKFYFVYTEKNW